jgi:hypothetical protein
LKIKLLQNTEGGVFDNPILKNIQNRLLMFKTLLTTILIIVAVSPIFAIIAVKDTIPVQVCDTLIDKNGVVSPVRIVSIGAYYIRFKQCSPNAKRITKVERSNIREIKNHTFTSKKPLSLLKRAELALRTILVSTSLFFFSILVLLPSFEGDSGDDAKWLVVPAIALLVLPFVIVGSLFYSISLLVKAKEAKNNKAAKKATTGIIVALIPILLVLRLLLG